MRAGYVLTNDNINKYTKIERQVKSLGKDYYKTLGCLSVRIVNSKYICFECDISSIIPMQLLDFSLQGLYTGEEKVTEFEKFGKYMCKVLDFSTIQDEEWRNGEIIL